MAIFRLSGSSRQLIAGTVNLETHLAPTAVVRINGIDGDFELSRVWPSEAAYRGCPCTGSMTVHLLPSLFTISMGFFDIVRSMLRMDFTPKALPISA